MKAHSIFLLSSQLFHLNNSILKNIRKGLFLTHCSNFTTIINDLFLKKKFFFFFFSVIF